MEQLGINPIFLLSQIVNFFVLAFLLQRFAYKPILNMLDKRKERIQEGLEEARLAEEARANAENERQQILDQAQIEAQGIVAEANQRADAQVASIVEDAHEQAQEMLKEARMEAKTEHDRVLGDLRGQIAALSIAAANQLIEVSLDEQRQQELVSEFFSGVQAGKVKVAAKVEHLEGQKAVVTSALPLSEQDKETYRAYLQSQLGAGVEVSFDVDTSLLGGVVLRVGDVVVDDSVAGKMSALRQSLS